MKISRLSCLLAFGLTLFSLDSTKHRTSANARTRGQQYTSNNYILISSQGDDTVVTISAVKETLYVGGSFFVATWEEIYFNLRLPILFSMIFCNFKSLVNLSFLWPFLCFLYETRFHVGRQSNFVTVIYTRVININKLCNFPLLLTTQYKTKLLVFTVLGCCLQRKFSLGLEIK